MKKKGLKRLAATLLAGVMCASMLGGCGSKAAASKSSSGGGKDSSKVTIWYYWETKSHQKGLNHIIDEYNASHKNVKVSAKYVPFADFKKQLSIGASAQELPDMVIQDNPDTASYAAMGIYADLTDKFDVSNYYKGPVDSCKLNGKLYGVPFGSNNLLLFYNKDMIEKAGVSIPKTWDELRTTAKQLTQGKVYGFAHCALQNEEGTFNFLPFVWSTGATSYQMDSAGAIKAMNFEKSLVDDGSFPKEAINWTQDDTMNQFGAGNLAMMINGTWNVATLRDTYPNLKFDVAPIPIDKKNVSALGGENYSVIKGGNEDGAIDFIKYATQKKQCLYLMNLFGYISADSTIAKTQFQDDETYQKFVKAMDYTQARGPLAQWPDVSDAISTAFNKVLTGSSTAEAAGKEAQQTIDSIIKK